MKALIVPKIKTKREKKITAINAWTVAVFKYIVGILKWRESKLKDVDRKIKENNDKVWRVTPKEQCGQIVHKVERWRQRSNECGMMH